MKIWAAVIQATQGGIMYQGDGKSVGIQILARWLPCWVTPGKLVSLPKWRLGDDSGSASPAPWGSHLPRHCFSISSFQISRPAHKWQKGIPVLCHTSLLKPRPRKAVSRMILPPLTACHLQISIVWFYFCSSRYGNIGTSSFRERLKLYKGIL